MALLRHTLLLVAALTLFSALPSLAQMREEIACPEKDGIVSIRPHQSCLSDDPDGQFEFPKIYSLMCQLPKAGFFESLRSSEDPELILHVPLSVLLPSKKLVGSVVITVEVDTKPDDAHRCFGRPIAATIDYLKEIAPKPEQLGEVGNRKFKASKLDRKLNPWIYCSKEKGCERGKSGTWDFSPDNTYDAYYRTTESGLPLYYIKCLGWNKECHGSGTDALQGRFDYSAGFPAALADHTFEIMDAIPAYLQSIYKTDK